MRRRNTRGGHRPVAVQIGGQREVAGLNAARSARAKPRVLVARSALVSPGIGAVAARGGDQNDRNHMRPAADA
jgi:hypothetical protein